MKYVFWFVLLLTLVSCGKNYYSYEDLIIDAKQKYIRLYNVNAEPEYLTNLMYTHYSSLYIKDKSIMQVHIDYNRSKSEGFIWFDYLSSWEGTVSVFKITKASSGSHVTVYPKGWIERNSYKTFENFISHTDLTAKPIK